MISYIHNNRTKLTFISLLFIMFSFIFKLTNDQTLIDIMLIIATVIAGMPIAIKAFQALYMKAFSIELLVMLAITGALFIQEYVESAVVAFLFLFGDYLEARTLAKTRSSIKELMDAAPQNAIVIRNDKQQTVSLEEIEVGERVIIQTGAKIPVDGKVIKGTASVNEATITGESIPASKVINDFVYTGTLVEQGYLEVLVEKIGNDTTFAKIIELVEEAQEAKSNTEKFLDKFARYYTPSVIFLSVIVYFLLNDLHIAITFLVIACPGALVIGAPVSTVAGIGNGAKHGILIKGGEVLEAFSKVNTIVFDKTGTLTKGSPQVTAIKIFDETYDEDELVQLVGQAETISEHHLGKAIVKEAQERDLNINQPTSEGEIIKGKGIQVKVEGKQLVIGNRKLLQQEEITLPQVITAYAEKQERLGNTAVYVAIDGKPICIISIADQIRTDTIEAINAFRKNDVKQLVMLTGDNKYTAELIANKLKLDDYQAELLPQEKVAYIKQTKNIGQITAMVGDGINDAPAIATADIGIAMGDSGTDISMDTADIVLMGGRLIQLVQAHALSKKTIRNMKQNTLFSMITVFVLLIGVLFDYIHLASGMFIHEASVLLVILNGMRLLKYKTTEINSN
ncbi:heavy metal translocating P-type ATPase [Virgibacillus sp. MG-45]|uniref:heavy metal translocating P-type ATPase n=1 Tax=Virgibacillus sp. MG-45 TaxID=3102791 RepID=UPI002ED7C8C8